MRRLGEQGPWPEVAHGLVCPDGCLGHVVRGTDLEGLRAYLARWLPTERG
ncbi:hypothetical protein ACIOHS_15465 [Streptomyces sp. NPDC088253]